MENIENFFKHKIIFTKPREDCDYYRENRVYSENRVYREGETVKWDEIYKSNTIYNHKKIGVTDREELLTQLKPFLYYLGSKDVNCEGYRYIFEVRLIIGFFWKYKNSNGEYIQIWSGRISRIGSELNFYSFFPCGDVTNRELEKPFEIHIDVQYYLLIVGAEEPEDELEMNWNWRMNWKKIRLPLLLANHLIPINVWYVYWKNQNFYS